MADLGEVTTDGTWRRHLFLGGALAALLAGLLALTAGSARLATDVLVGMGVPTPAARQIAIATVSTVPPIVLAGALVMTNEVARMRLLGLAGVAIALTGIAVGLPLGFESAFLLVALLYAGGISVLLLAVVHGFVVDPKPGGGDTTGWSRDATDTFGLGDSGPMPADGGDEDDDLTFLLENDEE